MSFPSSATVVRALLPRPKKFNFVSFSNPATLVNLLDVRPKPVNFTSFSSPSGRVVILFCERFKFVKLGSLSRPVTAVNLLPLNCNIFSLGSLSSSGGNEVRLSSSPNSSKLVSLSIPVGHFINSLSHLNFNTLKLVSTCSSDTSVSFVPSRYNIHLTLSKSTLVSIPLGLIILLRIAASMAGSNV